MTAFPLHSISTAPGGAKPFIAAAQRTYQRVPNLIATLAESPQAIEAYLAMDALFSRADLNEGERQIVLLTASIEHECHYCTAAHLREAVRAGVSPDVISALRNGVEIGDRRLEAMRAFTAAVVRNRGRHCEAEADALLKIGFPRAVLLDIVLAVALKLFSNYVNHIAETPLDAWLQDVDATPSE